MWAFSFSSREDRRERRAERFVDFMTICQEKPEEVRSWKQGVGGEMKIFEGEEAASFSTARETARIFLRVVASVL